MTGTALLCLLLYFLHQHPTWEAHAMTVPSQAAADPCTPPAEPSPLPHPRCPHLLLHYGRDSPPLVSLLPNVPRPGTFSTHGRSGALKTRRTLSVIFSSRRVVSVLL